MHQGIYATYFTYLNLKWWRIGDSNPWPMPCEGIALPTELTPHFSNCDGDRIKFCPRNIDIIPKKN